MINKEFKKWKKEYQQFEENKDWLCRLDNARYVWQRHGLFLHYECPICHKSVSRRLFPLKNKKDKEVL